MIADWDAREALDAFALPGRTPSCIPVPGGHINGTWRAGNFLLQRINPHVFPDGAALMHNVLAVTGRLAERAPARRRLELVPTSSGAWWHTDRAGAVWRLYRFVGHTRTHQVASTPDMARAAARAFGEFANITSDPPLELVTTIPAFHDTRRRLSALAAAAARDAMGRAAAVQGECARVLDEEAIAARIPSLMESGTVPRRVAHNDAKIANVLFDMATDSPVCVIDLDTTMPGSPLHDFGDLVRSMVSDTPEDAHDTAAVEVRDEYFAAIVDGYLAGSGNLLTDTERALLVTAARSIALEQAARFLGDYLDGDLYYRTSAPGENLRRARTQLALYGALTAKADQLERIVTDASPRARGRGLDG